jgi:uncharacterized surface protein with fasciclin (FAS1) repeats
MLVTCEIFLSQLHPFIAPVCIRINPGPIAWHVAAMAANRFKETHMRLTLRRSAALSLTAALLAAGSLVSTSAPSFSQEKTVTVGGAPMYPSKTIVENAVNSKDHTTLVAAVKAAGLVDTLSGKGPFTVFAPTNTAFEKLPKGTVETLVKPENKKMLTGILTYHVVPGSMSAADLAKQVKDGGGKVMLKTASGGQLTVMDAGGGKLSVTDAKGGKSMVTIADVNQSNGVIHVVDTVLMPAS